ncbi:MAG: XTP/dITP diphosphatase [Candidatus Omnitrophota bacterium]
MRQLVVATKNKKKFSEIKTLLKATNLKIVSLLDFPSAVRIREDGKTFRENAAKKALAIARFSGALALGEDSGLEVDALGGRPGVYSSRFAGSKKDDRLNNRKVLRLLGSLPLNKRTARYRCAVAIADYSGLIKTVEGTCEGLIGFNPKGKSGFGYDPVFIIPAYKKTFAQLGLGIKHKISHRARAIQKIKPVISKYLDRQSA